MKQAAKEVFENNMCHHDTMEEISKAYLSNQECFGQWTLYQILPEFKLRRILSALHCVFTNVPEVRVQILPTERPSELPDICPHILLTREQLLIVICKDQVQHSTMENTVF